MNNSPMKLEAKIMLLVWGMIAISLFVANYFINRNLAATIEHDLGVKTQEIAHLTAISPVVVKNLARGGDGAQVQQYANEVAQVTNSLFVVVFDMNSIRHSHPDAEKVGQHFVGGDQADALAGKEYISKSKGTMGDSLRAFSPVYDETGQQVGAVVVGISLSSVNLAVAKSQNMIYLCMIVGLLIGTAGAVILARKIKNTLLGLEPFAIARMVEERSAMLQSIREGIIAVDSQGHITMLNHEARRLLNLAGIQEDPVGKPVVQYIPNTKLENILVTGQAEYDQEQQLNGVNILTNRLPICVHGKVVGAIATFRDITEVRSLAEELTGVSAYVEALRAQGHEFMNKMQVVLGMLHMEAYDQLAVYVSRIASGQKAELHFVGKRIRDAVIAGFLLSKLSQAREMGAELILEEDSWLAEGMEAKLTHHLVTILGNLLNNALESLASASHKQVTLLIQQEEERLKIKVADTGAGMDDATARLAFGKGFSTKDSGRGLGLYLAAASLEALGGDIEFFSQPGQGTTFHVNIPYINKGDHHV